MQYDNHENVVKPPLGLKPKHIWDRERTLNILDAMYRYSEVKKPIPIEWINELDDILEKLRS